MISVSDNDQPTSDDVSSTLWEVKSPQKSDKGTAKSIPWVLIPSSTSDKVTDFLLLKIITWVTEIAFLVLLFQ
jgi:hypothetical protein